MWTGGAQGGGSRVVIKQGGGPAFDRVAKAAFKKFRFEPARNRTGDAVAAVVGPVIYKFRLEG